MILFVYLILRKQEIQVPNQPFQVFLEVDEGMPSCITLPYLALPSFKFPFIFFPVTLCYCSCHSQSLLKPSTSYCLCQQVTQLLKVLPFADFQEAFRGFSQSNVYNSHHPSDPNLSGDEVNCKSPGSVIELVPKGKITYNVKNAVE